MNIKKILLLLLLFCLAARAQKKSPELDLKNLNYQMLETEFIERLNQMREGMSLGKLSADNILKRAAKDQADYQQSIHQLSHSQPTKDKETPQKRVFFYNGTHDHIGENCIKIPLKKPFKAKYSKKELEAKTYSDAGEALFLGWKNSPGHYKNMIDPDYEMYGLGFSFDKDSSNLYCAQVFGQKPFVPGIEYRSPGNAYDIRENNPNICEAFNTNEGRIVMQNIQVIIQGDSLFLRSEKAWALTRFFTQPGDAIYFDIVQRTQFVCERHNLLHGSPIYDGKMLKPVLFKDIFKRSRIKDGKNMFASICALPPQMKKAGQRLQLNYGIVKSGFMCQYIYPIEVPDNNLEMLDLYPKWIYKPDLELQPDSVEGRLSFYIPFERNESALNEKSKKQLTEKLSIYKPFITSVDLQTFSSVEGSSQGNLKLQEQRASNIIALLKDYTKDAVNFNKQANENWEEFFELIEHTPWSYMKDLPREKIKEKLKSKKLLDSLDYLLRKNRTALLTIGLKARIDNQSNPYLILLAYKKSIENGDSLKSFTQQNKILEYITHYEFRRGDLLPIEIPLTRKFLPHLTNYLAVAIKDDELVYSRQARDLAVRTYKVDENYLPVKFNCCIMALRYLKDFQDTIFPIQQLEKNMNECYKLGTYDDSIIVNHMWLNYSILSVYRNWQAYHYDQIDRHLLNIKKYYPGAHISENEAVRLGLLFNLYARYDWTIDLLLPYLRNKSKSDDLLFLFIETRTKPYGDLSQQEWEKYLRKARNSDKMRFYKWIDEVNFQLLRDDVIKKEFCEIKFQ
jgi:uncharacterized protein YkwD